MEWLQCNWSEIILCRDSTFAFIHTAADQPHFRDTQYQQLRNFAAMEVPALNSSFLSGSLLDDSRSLFEQWKRHLEFQYDFVKVWIIRLHELKALQGIIQENDRFRQEIDRLEKELYLLQKFQEFHTDVGRRFDHLADNCNVQVRQGQPQTGGTIEVLAI